MATSDKLQLTFLTTEGKESTHSFSNADQAKCTSANVKALAAAMVDSGATIFSTPYASAQSAKFIQTVTTDIDIS